MARGAGAGAFYQEAALLFASMRPSEVLELPGGDGLVYIYDAAGDEAEDPREILREIRIERERALVKAVQLEDDIAIGNPWDELPAPAPPRRQGVPSRARPTPPPVAPARREDRLAVLIAAAHEKLEAMDRAAGIAITKVQTRADISAAMEHRRVAR